MKIYECDVCHAKVNDYAHWENGEPRSLYELQTIHEYNKDSYQGMIICQKCFEALKRAGVPKDGVWVGVDEEPHEDWECSCCGHIVYAIENIEEGHYCPNCGARMEVSE